MGFRDTLKYLVFKPPEASMVPGRSDEVGLDEIARSPISLTTPASEIPAPQGKVDFQAIFRSANLVGDNPLATAEKAIELRANLSALPETTQVEGVEATLKTFGIAEQTIVRDAVSKGEAIEAYLEATQSETKSSVDRTNVEMAELARQIEAKKKEVQDRMTRQEAVNRACQSEMEKYADLVRFLASNDTRPAS